MFRVSFTKIRSFTRASDFCSYETFKDALMECRSPDIHRAKECLPLVEPGPFALNLQLSKIPLSGQEPWECWLSRHWGNIFGLPIEGHWCELKL